MVPLPGTAPCKTAATYIQSDPDLLERLSAIVDYVEVTPDVLAVGSNDRADLDERAIGELADLGLDAGVIVHGVGLSIGSHDGYREDYLHLLDLFLEQVPVAWHSEHLGFTHVDGEFVGTMLPLPKTEEAFDMIAERVTRLQDRYGLPFLLENVVHLLPDYEGDLSEAAFLNKLSASTNCGLLLDVYNLQCDEANHGFDINAFLDELDLDRVVEIHVAGGVKHRGFTLDVHSRQILDSTLDLATSVASRAPNVQVVTYEVLQEAIPSLGRDSLIQQLEQIQRALQPELDLTTR